MRVDDCPAGPALDAAVAKALGCDVMMEKYAGRLAAFCSCELREHENPTMYVSGMLKCYSRDIAAAWELEQEMPYFKLIRSSSTYWQCKSVFCGDWLDHLCSSCGCQSADAETVPLAICRAFLKAKGVTEVEI